MPSDANEPEVDRTSDTTRGRGRDQRTRLRARARLVAAAAVGAGLVAGAGWAATAGDDDGATARPADALELDAEGRSGSQQVLGETREPGVPSVQRMRHDDVDFTVTVAPSRPGPNLVRIDATGAGHRRHLTGADARPVLVGTTESTELVRAVPRPGASGLWAVVDLPEKYGTVLVTHGPRHRVPFGVDTGFEAQSDDEVAAWTGDDGAECVTAATAAMLAGGDVPDACPAQALAPGDAVALRRTVAVLGERGVAEVALRSDASPRGRAASAVVRRAADRAGLEVVDPDAVPGRRNALLVVSGWTDAARSLAAVIARPLPEQPIRDDGTWLAPWLLSPAVVDSTAGAVVPLDFDIRDPAAQEYSQTLARYLPGQTPTGSGYAAWRAARGGTPSPPRLFAASRAAFMPTMPGHGAHGSEVAWFPGGTVTPVGSL
ncbi:hypothetical protein [Nocardioides marinquilinus]|uniref:hypothetical protein n=1 Tax=Nocardioides marinquilinus TaxID=1210400 RepID=UPI0031EFCDF0